MSCGAAPAASASSSAGETRAGEVADRSQRPWDREVVAGAEQHARAGFEVAAGTRVTSEVLPIPGSPVTTTTRPSPRAASACASASVASAASRSSRCTIQR